MFSMQVKQDSSFDPVSFPFTLHAQRKGKKLNGSLHLWFWCAKFDVWRTLILETVHTGWLLPHRSSGRPTNWFAHYAIHAKMQLTFFFWEHDSYGMYFPYGITAHRSGGRSTNWFEKCNPAHVCSWCCAMLRGGRCIGDIFALRTRWSLNGLYSVSLGPLY